MLQKNQMQQSVHPSLSALEMRLAREIEKIEEHIHELTQEKNALLRQLAKIRMEQSHTNEITRKNSMNRVAIERKIIESIRHSKKIMKTKDLYKEALLIDFDLKYSTFRNYLYRMKQKDIIFSSGHSGYWRLRPEA